MKDFFERLIPKIQEAIMVDFRDIKKQIGDETIYTAVLATDSDCITLGLWINTIEQIKLKDIEYGFYDKDKYIEDNKDFLSAEEIDEIRGSDAPAETVKWIPDEWIYSSEKAGGTVDLCDLLYEKNKSLYDEADEVLEEFCNLFIETITTAFRNLIQSNSFGLAPEEVTYFIHMTDDDRANEIVKKSSKVFGIIP